MHTLAKLPPLNPQKYTIPSVENMYVITCHQSSPSLHFTQKKKRIHQLIDEGVTYGTDDCMLGIIRRMGINSDLYPLNGRENDLC